MRRSLLALVLALYALPVLADQNGQGQDGQGNGTEILDIAARVVAVHIPGASALAQVGTFLNVPPPGACANPIPTRSSIIANRGNGNTPSPKWRRTIAWSIHGQG